MGGEHLHVLTPQDIQGGGTDEYYFGPYRFDAEKRSLFRADVPVPLNSRFAVLLTILLQNAGLLISQDSLEAGTSGKREANRSSLRVYMSKLSRLLGQQADSTPFFVNEHGRGYRFVAAVATRRTEPLPTSAYAFPPVAKLVGREKALRIIEEILPNRRFVSLVGPGGIGKSAMAIAYAVQQRERYPDGIHFFDLALVDDPRSVTTFAANQLQLTPEFAPDPRAFGIALRDKRALLVFDNCERVLEGVTPLAEVILSLAPYVHLIATSREALRADGEKVFRVAALDYPPEEEAVNAEAALKFSAVQLFVERAAAVSERFRLDENNAESVIDICRRVDGLPLAIELVAGWADVFGLDELARSLDNHFLIKAAGRRTALPRHRTLTATIEWSYDALSPAERTTLNRLSVYRASFNLVSAMAVAVDETLDTDAVTDSVAGLVAKSLLSIDLSYPNARYRLLETTRHYAAERLLASADQRAVHRRHAGRCLELLKGADGILRRLGRKTWIGLYRILVADTLVALEWAFSESGDVELGVALTAASTIFGEQFVLHREYDAFIHRALRLIDTGAISDAATELELKVNLGFVLELNGDAETAYVHASTIPRVGSPSAEITPRTLTRRWSATFVAGRYLEFREIAAALEDIAEQANDPEVEMVSRRVMSQSLHFLGQHKEAKRLAQLVLDSPYEYLPFTNVSHKISMRIVLARIAFLEGNIREASDRLDELLAMGQRDNPVAFCQILGIACVPTALWSHDIDKAENLNGRLRQLARANDMGFWKVFSEQLQIAVGLLSGSMRLRPARAMGFGDEPVIQMITDMAATFDARLLTSATVARVEQGLVGWCAPEVIRVDALRLAGSDAQRARLMRGLALAQDQGAALWKQRIEVSLKDVARPQRAGEVLRR